MQNQGSDEVAANLDYGVISGYFVRVDVDMQDGSGTSVMACIDVDAARELAAQLLATADEAERRNHDDPP